MCNNRRQLSALLRYTPILPIIKHHAFIILHRPYTQHGRALESKKIENPSIFPSLGQIFSREAKKKLRTKKSIDPVDEEKNNKMPPGRTGAGHLAIMAALFFFGGISSFVLSAFLSSHKLCITIEKAYN